MLTVNSLAKSYGSDTIFRDVSFHINPGERLGLFGPNGCGKTTLLRILTGIEQPDSGSYHFSPPGLRRGYLSQGLTPSPDETLSNFLDRMTGELLSARTRLEKLAVALAATPQNAGLQHEFDATLQQIPAAAQLQGQIGEALGVLGLGDLPEETPIETLSGGQKTRLALAGVLLSSPQLLLMDEPTNHLDIEMLEWLEDWLVGSPLTRDAAILIVSHDRYFLDSVTDHIWEMNHGGMEAYRGNYSAYLRQRQERWELRQQVFESEKERLEKDLDYIRKNIAGQNTLQAKGRLKRLSRTLDAIEKGGFQSIQGKKWAEISDETGATSQMMSVDEVTQRIRALHNPVTRPPRLKLNLKASWRSGDLVLRTYYLAIGFPDEGRPLFRVPDLVLKRGECAALIGPNGAGKTTFLKTLLGKIPPLEGELLLGASLEVAYFAQAHEDLNAGRTLVEEIDNTAPHMLLGEIRDYLARYLFSGDDVFKKVATLSGGERGRLALAKLSMMKSNLLLLDEPTNHLDIPSQELLQEILGEYQGTILLVSHDRYLIDALGTQIWEIEPDQTSLRDMVTPFSYT